MKWRPLYPRWKVTFGGNSHRVMVVRGMTPEDVADRVVWVQFGRSVRARRITGKIGEPGAFEAVGWHGEHAAVFEVNPEEER